MIPLRIVLAGASGRTGRMVADLAVRRSDISLIGVVRGRQSHPYPDVTAFDRLDDAPPFDVLIDFTSPAVTASLAGAAAARRVAIVTGTTGLNAGEQAGVAAAAAGVPVVQAGNFSAGVTLLAALLAQAARALPEADLEIEERHHRDKVDAPSGTALLLGRAAAAARGTTLETAGRYSRHGQTGPRPRGEIGFAVTRGGGVIGDHAVHLLETGEVLTLSHRALDRQVFAAGALRAALWAGAAGRPAGLYDMADVLGLS